MNPDDEVWRPVLGWVCFYEVSTFGRVRSLDRIFIRCDGRPFPVCGRVLKPARNKRDGRYFIHLSAPGVDHIAYVATIVAEAFIGPRPIGLDLCHENGINTDDRPQNLYWATTKQNMADRARHGRTLHGSRCHFAALKEDDVYAIKNLRWHLDNKKLAWIYGVSQHQICQIQNGHAWRRVRAGAD